MKSGKSGTAQPPAERPVEKPARPAKGANPLPLPTPLPKADTPPKPAEDEEEASEEETPPPVPPRPVLSGPK